MLIVQVYGQGTRCQSKADCTGRNILKKKIEIFLMILNNMTLKFFYILHLNHIQTNGTHIVVNGDIAFPMIPTVPTDQDNPQER